MFKQNSPFYWHRLGFDKIEKNLSCFRSYKSIDINIGMVIKYVKKLIPGKMKIKVSSRRQKISFNFQVFNETFLSSLAKIKAIQDVCDQHNLKKCSSPLI